VSSQSPAVGLRYEVHYSQINKQASKQASKQTSKQTNKTHSVAFNPQANYTDRATAAAGEV
jgi:hypothetical protein